MIRSGLMLVVVALLVGCPKKDEGEQVDPKVKADGHYLAGQTAYLKGDFAEAHAQFDEVKKLNPSDPRLNGAEGELFIAEAKLDEALKCFERAVAADPKRSTSWSRLGYLYNLKNDSQKASDALGKALAANPNDYNALETLADLKLKAGDWEAAVSNWVRASEVSPEQSKGEFVMKAVAELTKQKQPDRALTQLEAATKRGVKTAEIFTELGDRLAAAKRLEEAVTAYSEAAKLDPKDPTLFELAAEAQLALGKREEAAALFAESLKVKDRSVVHVALARLCQQRKDEGCLKTELDQALVTADGKEVRESIELSRLLASVSRKKDALDLLQTVASEPDQLKDADLQLELARLARDAKDTPAMAIACGRATKLKPGLKCP